MHLSRGTAARSRTSCCSSTTTTCSRHTTSYGSSTRRVPKIWYPLLSLILNLSPSALRRMAIRLVSLPIQASQTRSDHRQVPLRPLSSLYQRRLCAPLPGQCANVLYCCSTNTGESFDCIYCWIWRKEAGRMDQCWRLRVSFL